MKQFQNPVIAVVLTLAIAVAFPSSPLLGNGGPAPPPPTLWTIVYPTNGTQFPCTANVPAQGAAAKKDYAYILTVYYYGGGGGQQSANGNSTGSYNWSAVVNPPAAHGNKWPIGLEAPNGYLALYVDGDIVSSVTIDFYDPQE